MRYSFLLEMQMCIGDMKYVHYLGCKSSDSKLLNYLTSFPGEVPANGTEVSMESSQFSNEVLVTQVKMIIF